jgi:chromosome partitioning protein
MLDLVSAAGEYDILEVRRSEETLMRGRRRGRNKSSPPDVQNPSPEAVSAPLPTGAVTLVEAAPALQEEPVTPDPTPAARTETPIAVQHSAHSGGTPLKDTISQVATAHAELDNVLPPYGGGPVTIAAPTAAEGVSAATEQISSVDVPEMSKAEESPPPARGVVVEVPEHDEPPVNPAPAPAERAEVEPDVPDPVVERADEVVTSEPEPATEEPPQPAEQSASGNPLPRVMAVANQKGGVGKTTTSVNLGAALAEIGFRVLVIDLDPQGNATTGLGIDARNFELSMYDVLMRDASLEDCVEPTSMKNLFVAPATIALAGAEIELVPAFSRELKLKRSIESIIDDFDYVLIDCPPSLGLITVNALAAADEVLVPIQCEYYALEGLSQLMRNVHLVASNLNPELDISTIVLTMYDARTKLAEQVANEVRLHFGAKVCRNVIPRTVRLSEAPSFGQPITAFDPTSRGAIAYRELAKEVSGGTT